MGMIYCRTRNFCDHFIFANFTKIKSSENISFDDKNNSRPCRPSHHPMGDNKGRTQYRLVVTCRITLMLDNHVL